jgi:hypothetical protein
MRQKMNEGGLPDGASAEFCQPIFDRLFEADALSLREE